MPNVLSNEPATIDPAMEPAAASGSMVLLTRLSRLVYRSATEALLGMSLKEYMALNNLREQGRLTQQALGDSLHLDANNCVLLLNVLEAGRFAERRRDPGDRRRHIVELTAEGRVAVERADRALETVEDQVLVALSAEERATLRRLLLHALEAEREVAR
jgi:DNA-binding MarR family transcriptional regulator